MTTNRLLLAALAALIIAPALVPAAQEALGTGQGTQGVDRPTPQAQDAADANVVAARQVVASGFRIVAAHALQAADDRHVERHALRLDLTRQQAALQAEEEARAKAAEDAERKKAEQEKRAQAVVNYRTGNTVWDRLAQCESGGNWAINTGNGYYGGLQFNIRSWQWVGGTGYPHEHSREEQIHRAEKLLALQGWGAWPACSKKLGLR